MKPGVPSPKQLPISNALSQINSILETSDANYKVMEWKDQKLHILDPYFLFYLRWAEKIETES